MTIKYADAVTHRITNPHTSLLESRVPANSILFYLIKLEYHPDSDDRKGHRQNAK